MKFSTSISVLALASLALAGKQFKTCVDFGGSTIHDKQTPGFNITVKEDTSLLIYRLKDLPYTNIPLGYDKDYDLEQNEDDFKICDEQMVSKGECSTIGEFSFKTKGDKSLISSPIVNVFAKPGFQTFYPIQEPGVYCFIGTHEYPENCVFTKFIQPHGYLPVDQYWKMILFSHLISPIDCLIALFAIIKLVKLRLNKDNQSVSVLGRQIFGFAIVNAIYKVGNMYSLRALNHTGFTFWNFATAFLSNPFRLGSLFTLMSLLYAFANGYGGLLYSDECKTSKKFIFLNFLYLVAIQNTELVPPNLNGADLVYYRICRVSYVVSLVGMVFIYIKSSKATLNKIEDKVMKRNYKLSRNLAIFSPILLFLTSVMAMTVWGYKSSLDVMKTSTLDVLMEKIVINAVESKVRHRFIWALLENMTSFSWTVIALGFMIIWRKQLTVNDNTSEVEKTDLVEITVDEKK